MINKFTPFTTYFDVVTPEQFRRCIVANALSAVDVSAGVVDDIPSFRQIIGDAAPWDLSKPFKVVRDANGNPRTEGVSTCGLVAAGLLSRSVTLPWVGYPYYKAPGYFNLDIVSCLSRLGGVIGAFRTRGEYAQPGDIFVMGSGLTTHVATVVGFEGDQIVTVDGGQVDADHKFLQCIRLRKRAWSDVQKRLVWVLNSEKLRYATKCPIVAPEGALDVALQYHEATTPSTGENASSWRSLAWVQGVLDALGYGPLKVDGIIGPQTKKAIASFQLDHGLTPDGIVGAKTGGVLVGLVDSMPVLEKWRSR